MTGGGWAGPFWRPTTTTTTTATPRPRQPCHLKAFHKAIMSSLHGKHVIVSNFQGFEETDNTEDGSEFLRLLIVGKISYLVSERAGNSDFLHLQLCKLSSVHCPARQCQLLLRSSHCKGRQAVICSCHLQWSKTRWNYSILVILCSSCMCWVTHWYSLARPD